jgi:hypothetical protein
MECLLRFKEEHPVSRPAKGQEIGKAVVQAKEGLPPRRETKSHVDIRTAQEGPGPTSDHTKAALGKQPLNGSQAEKLHVDRISVQESRILIS